jgi:hypothetical protein
MNTTWAAACRPGVPRNDRAASKKQRLGSDNVVCQRPQNPGSGDKCQLVQSYRVLSDTTMLRTTSALFVSSRRRRPRRRQLLPL